MTLPLRAVFFDMDGTVLDTAPDMATALNTLRAQEGLAPMDFETVRCTVSHGAARVVKSGFPDSTDAEFEALKRRFLNIYRGALCVRTQLFPGMAEVLDGLGARGLKSGIVTNKAGWLTEPLLEQMRLRSRFDCVVSGDTTRESKPHPLPLLHAAELAGVAPVECIYVGDAERDVQAARGAGMAVLVADYGYQRADEDTRAWRGDAYLAAALDLLAWLDACGRL